MLCRLRVYAVKSVLPTVCVEGVIDMLKSPILKAAERVCVTTPSERLTVNEYCPEARLDCVATTKATATVPPVGRTIGFWPNWQAAPFGKPRHVGTIRVEYPPTLPIKRP